MESLRHWRYLCLEAKTAYQKNLIKSGLLVYGLTALTLTLAVFLPRPSPVSTGPDSSGRDHPDATLSTSSAAAKGVPGPSSGTGSSSLSSIYRRLGHNNLNIRVVRDDLPKPPSNARLEPELTQPDPETASLLSHSSVSDGDFPTYSAGNGGSDLYGLGDNTFGLPSGLYCPPYVRGLDGRSPRSDGLINAPVFMGLAIPPFPSTARPDDTGIVVVDLTVSKKGYVSYKTISVEPAGYGFGNAAEWAITSGRYSPRFDDGVAVDCTIRLTLVMTRNPDPSAEKPTAEFTHSSPDVTPVWLNEK